MKLHILNFSDHRTPQAKIAYSAIEQARADARIQLLWASRVRANIFRRQMGEVALVRRQAE